MGAEGQQADDGGRALGGGDACAAQQPGIIARGSRSRTDRRISVRSSSPRSARLASAAGARSKSGGWRAARKACSSRAGSSKSPSYPRTQEVPEAVTLHGFAERPHSWTAATTTGQPSTVPSLMVRRIGGVNERALSAKPCFSPCRSARGTGWNPVRSSSPRMMVPPPGRFASALSVEVSDWGSPRRPTSPRCRHSHLPPGTAPRSFHSGPWPCG